MATKKPKFNSYYGTKNEVHSNAGNRYSVDYELMLDKDGKEHLEPCGQTDLYAFIQSHRDSVDFNLIIARYMQGDVNALERAQGFYEDVSGMNTNLAEVMNMIRTGKNVFDGLPTEVKELYNNDYQQFVANPSKAAEFAKKQVSALNVENFEEVEEVVTDEQ